MWWNSNQWIKLRYLQVIYFLLCSMSLGKFWHAQDKLDGNVQTTKWDFFEGKTKKKICRLEHCKYSSHSMRQTDTKRKSNGLYWKDHSKLLKILRKLIINSISLIWKQMFWLKWICTNTPMPIGIICSLSMTICFKFDVNLPQPSPIGDKCNISTSWKFSSMS